MKVYLACLFVAFSVVAVFAQDQVPSTKPSDDPLVKELIRITSTIYDAGMSGDRSTIDKLLVDDFLETDAIGVLRDKSFNLTNFLPSNEKIIYEIQEPQVRVHGDMAVLYYIWSTQHQRSTNVKTQTGGSGSFSVVTTRLRVMDTFVKAASGWRLAASSRIVLR